jgi:hypothetical protein
MTGINVRKSAAGAAMAGAVGLGLLGLGAGLSQADPSYPVPPVPGIPGPVVPAVPAVNTWNPSMPPGQNPFGPPGQVMKMQTLNVNGVEVPNPFYGVPPGHWDDPAYLNLDALTWQPAGYSNVTAPLKVVWNGSQWGVNVDAETFVAFPIQLPAPKVTG